MIHFSYLSWTYSIKPESEIYFHLYFHFFMVWLLSWDRHLPEFPYDMCFFDVMPKTKTKLVIKTILASYKRFSYTVHYTHLTTIPLFSCKCFQIYCLTFMKILFTFYTHSSLHVHVPKTFHNLPKNLFSYTIVVLHHTNNKCVFSNCKIFILMFSYFMGIFQTVSFNSIVFEYKHLNKYWHELHVL